MRLTVDCTSITPGRSAGVENFTYGLLNGLAKSRTIDGIVVYVAFGTEALWKERLHAHSAIKVAEVGRFRSRALAQLSNLMKLSGGRARAAWGIHALQCGVKGLTVFRRSRPDVSYFPFHRNVLCGHPSVTTAHDLRVLQQDFYDPIEARQLQSNLERATAVVASWPHPFRQLTEAFPELSRKMFCIPLPLLVSTGRPPLEEDDRRPISGRRLLLYPAATAPHKNHTTLIKAMGLLSKEYDVHLVCTGPLVSPVAERLREEVETLGLVDRVELTGFIDEARLQALYRHADAVIVPSLWEAASGPVFEAFAWHKPVACSVVEPIRAGVEFAGGSASFFDPLDPDDIASAVVRVFEDPSPYVEGAKRAWRFLSAFNWDHCAEDYVKVFEWAAAGGRGERPVLRYEPHRP